MSYRDQVVIVIPSLNPDEKLTALVKNLREHGFSHILLINDGSRPDCIHYFEESETLYGCRVYTHAVNLGKGRALKSAFNTILNEYPDCIGAVTVDSDGQHTMEDTTACAKALVEHPDHLIIGCRNFSEPGIPPRSRFGNVCTRQAIKLLCGISVSDTQTGLRGISKSFMQRMLPIKGERFEYELNMLIEAKESGTPFFEVPIRTIYIESNESSHFNPLLDSIRIYSVFLKFILSSMSSFIVDIVLFSVFLSLFNTFFAVPEYSAIGIPAATVLARIFSSLFNFFVNKRGVFKNASTSKATLVKYFTLTVVQMCLSATGVWAAHLLLNWNETLLKVIIDCLLFFVSFTVQRSWVFK